MEKVSIDVWIEVKFRIWKDVCNSLPEPPITEWASFSFILPIASFRIIQNEIDYEE